VSTSHIAAVVTGKSFRRKRYNFLIVIYYCALRSLYW